MSTTTPDIRQALETALLALLVASPPGIAQADVVFENVKYRRTTGTKHARVFVLAAKSSQASLGTGALKRRPGVAQVSLYYPEGAGARDAEAAAQALENGLPVGTVLTKNSTRVEVTNVSKGPGAPEDDWYVVPVSVAWLVYSG